MFDLKEDKTFDLNQAANHLAAAIRFKTVSYPDSEMTDFTEYEKFLVFLTETYPEVHRICKKEMVNTYSPIFIWEGSDKGKKPLLLIGHYDVVPAGSESSEEWQEPPFSGTIKDDYIWGRGAIDDKHQVISIMEAVEYLIESGFQPKRDIYIAFGFDEEVGGKMGAEKLAALFKERHLEFECVIDEGGCITTDMMEGLDTSAALIGIAEKAWANFKITVTGQGGHSSIPPTNTAVGVLAQIIANIENHPMPARLILPVKEMFRKMAPHMQSKRFVLKNIEPLFPIINSALGKNATTNAMIRTTTAVTMTGGGDAPNVLPQKAWAVVNARILQGDTVDEVIAHIKKVNPGIDFTIETLLGENPSKISSLDAHAYKTIESIIAEMYPDVLVMPYLMVGGTDSRKYAEVCDNLYRFAAMVLPKELYETIHSNNERISTQNLFSMIEFYCKFITAMQ
ncbi:MAG: M20 family peptidase [Bacillota bacterium]|nr:M20 family peptidase [Bacillota bacterium]